MRITYLSGGARRSRLPRGPLGSTAGASDPESSPNALIWGLGAATAAYLALLGLMAFNESRQKIRYRSRANDTRFR